MDMLTNLSMYRFLLVPRRNDSVFFPYYFQYEQDQKGRISNSNDSIVNHGNGATATGNHNQIA